MEYLLGFLLSIGAIIIGIGFVALLIVITRYFEVTRINKKREFIEKIIEEKLKNIERLTKK